MGDRLRHVTAEWPDWMLPLSFVLTSTANFIFFYLGLCLRENKGREIGFLLVACLFALGCGLTFLHMVWQKKIRLCQLIMPAVALLFYVVCFGLWYFHFGTAGGWLNTCEHFIVFSIPALLCGICAAVSHSEERFFQNIERMTFLIVPGAAFYSVSAIFQANPYNWGRDFGIISYMSFAYTIMPFLLVHLLCFFDEKPFWLPVRSSYAAHPQRIRGALIALYWFAILASGTRGTYFCVCGFCIVAVFSRLLHRQPVKKTAITSALLIGLLLFSIFVCTIPGLQNTSRMSIFVDGLKSGQLVTTDGEDPRANDAVEELVAAEGGAQVTNRPVEEPPVEEPPVEESPDIAEENIQIGSRGTLFKLSFLEFKKSPLVGMHPGGFTVKYGMYPHSVVFELLCETGLLGTTLLLALLVAAIIRILCVGWVRPETRNLFLFFVAYAIQANISGSLWDCPALLAAISYGLTVSGSSLVQKGDKASTNMEH